MSVARIILTLIGCFVCTSSVTAKQPHIIFFMADDLGWNDVGFHNEHVHTPNIDALADRGLVLNQSYAQPSCTPSRHAFLTGRYPFRDGMQHLVMQTGAAVCSPRDVKMMPEKLKELGYATHLVGKWHLGFCHESCLPTSRGFDSFYGSYGGAADHYTYREADFGEDLHYNDEQDSENIGKYSGHTHTERAETVIAQHDPDTPLFLFMAYTLPHTPLQVPERYKESHSDIPSEQRRTYLAMVSALDESVGNITQTLGKHGMLDDALLVFMSDNGGRDVAGSNNYPLAGGKCSLYEGGTRAPTVVAGPGVTRGASQGMFHMTDWYPTFVSAAGGTVEPCVDGEVDGVDQWPLLTEGAASARDELVYNIDSYAELVPPVCGMAALRYGDYKLISGFPGVVASATLTHRPAEMCAPDSKDPECAPLPAFQGRAIRMEAIRRDSGGPIQHKLYNVTADPEERRDLSAAQPELTALLAARLDQYRQHEAAPLNLPAAIRDLPPGPLTPGWCTGDELAAARAESLARAAKRAAGPDTQTCERRPGL